MVNKECKIIEKENEKYLEFDLINEKALIPLTVDDAIAVKEVFNKFIIELKKGEFNFELNVTNEDLYNNISKEYIESLNNELSSIYLELTDNGLLD